MSNLHENLSRLHMDELTTALIRLGDKPYSLLYKSDLVAAVEEALNRNSLGPLFTVGPEGTLLLHELWEDEVTLTDALVRSLPLLEESLHLLRGYGLAWHTRGRWELTTQAETLLHTLDEERLLILYHHDALYTAIHGCLNLYGMVEMGELLAMLSAAGWPAIQEGFLLGVYTAVCPPEEALFVPENDVSRAYLCSDELDDPEWLYEQLQKEPQRPLAAYTLEDYRQADLLPGKPEIYLPMRKWLHTQGASDAQAEHLLYDVVFAYLNDPDAPLSVFASALLEYAHGRAALTPDEQAMLLSLMEQLPQWTLRGHSLRSLRRAEARRNAVGRDDYCPCGSGRKYGKCCGNFH